MAYLSKLEDQVRSEMEKTGASLPPKNDAYAYAGKGGPSLGNASVVSIMLEEEKNIQNQAKAKESDLQNLLSAIESENYRREVTPSCWPTSGGYISSSFGGRYNPLTDIAVIGILELILPMIMVLLFMQVLLVM